MNSSANVDNLMHLIETELAIAETLTLRNEKSSVPAVLPEHDLHSYINAATSQNTRKAYRQDLQHFTRWGGLLPATPEIIIAYLQAHATSLNPRTLTRRLTALKNWHLCQGFSDPTPHLLVRKVLAGIQNIHGRPKEKAPALTLEQLATVSLHLEEQDTLQAYRNNALLQIGFFAALRRSELVALQCEHITFVPEGIQILIPRSKTDPKGEGQTCAVPYGDGKLCPVTALKRWMEKAALQTGPVFRAINKHHHMNSIALSSRSINLIIKSLAIQCKLPQAEKFSGHSLRRGFATCASKKGASFVTIMRHGRWRHEGTVLGYIEEGQQFEDNAVNIILNTKPKTHVESYPSMLTTQPNMEEVT